jgi:hypothetical protein
VGHLAHIGEIRNAYRILIRNPEQTTQMSGIEWEDKLEWIFGKYGLGVQTGFV